MGIDANKTTSIGWTHIKTAAQVVQAFYARTRWLFVLTVLTRSISRLLQLLTFFLPLKIIILASYEAPPNWLPESVGIIDHSSAIMALIGIFIIVYMFYLAISAAHHKLYNANAQAQLNHGDLSFVGEPTNKNKIKQLHKKSVSISSDATIVVLGAVSIAVASSILALFTLIVVCLFYIVAIKLTFRYKLKQIYGLTSNQIVDYLASIFFVFLFTGLSTGVFLFDLNVFVAVYALVIGRPLIQATHRLTREISYENIFMRRKLRIF
jgi:hypothetical protein